MAQTLLSLTNRVLTRLNEVNLTVDNFTQARGLHKAAIDAVSDTVVAINRKYTQWPWNAAQHTQKLSIGVNEYAWPSGFIQADWETFSIDQDATTGVDFRQLMKIDRDVWYKSYRPQDYDRGTSGRNVPRYVFESHGRGFGVSPSPDKEYDLTFRYYTSPTYPTLPTEEINIPDNLSHVVVNGAMVQMQIFKNNTDAVQLISGIYEKDLTEMRYLYGRRFDSVRDTRV